MEAAVIHGDTSTEERNWGVLGDEAADAEDAFIIFISCAERGALEADKKEAFLSNGDHPANALHRSGFSAKSWELELICQAITDHGGDSTAVELSHDLAFELGCGACGCEGVEAKVSAAWVEVVSTGLHDDLLRGEPATVYDQWDVRVVLYVMMMREGLRFFRACVADLPVELSVESNLC